MPKPKSTPIEDQLRDFEQAPGVPKNLGNFPDDLDTPALQQRMAPIETPEPDPEPEPDSAAGEPTQPESPREEPAEEETPAERRMRELEERVASRDRELEFLRAGYQQGAQQQVAQPVAPGANDAIKLIDQYLGGYQVTAEDVQTIISDPEKGATYLMNGIRAAIAAGASLAMNQLRAEYGQVRQGEQGAAQLRAYFYGKNPDLEKYARLVGVHAQEIRAQYPQASNEQLCDEAARRTRAELKSYGVSPERPTGVPAQPRTRRGAYGDMGGRGGGGGGGKALSPIEKQLREFEAGTQQFR